MAKDISRIFGVPSTREKGIEQHRELRDKLRQNGVYSLNSMNRGYLVLRRTLSPIDTRRRGSQKVYTWRNILQNAKPTGIYIMMSKV